MSERTCGFTAAATVAILAGACFFVLSSRTVPAQEQAQAEASESKTLARKLIGTWKLDEAANPGSPSGIGTRLKMFTGTHWCVIQPSVRTGVIVFQHGGRYEVDGDTIKTSRDFAGESTKGLIGTSGKFKIKIDGDTLKQSDSQGVYNETWKRVR